ncbi:MULTISPECIES: inositol 2-dehydrogenase [Erwiniaceae]|uniref:inositol 2-dehydrogenase n=1 Tax=Erwiniaceae TaxID=1903409 RepID=UPI00190B2E1B|nr:MULTISPECIES: inositol 2-dehydrogenase [Erwiniaceae]MBK0090176.1 inositol 2-dehydrogenase [Erwinia sp. S59]MBK0125743.1 inositol 2-dehydrogenase [Pantoea sp. S61]
MLKVALLGAGRIGQIHAGNIAAHPQCSLAYVMDVYAPAANALAEKYGAQVADLDTILADSSIDLVAICSATNTHADLIEAAARAQKAIFCEKPVDLSLERVQSCLATVRKAGVPLMVGFNRRFDPSMAHLQACLRDGEIGETELVTISSRDPGAPPAEYVKVSGGLFRDMTIHDFDMARWLLNEEPVSVFASAAALVDPEIKALGDVDTAVVTLTCASGKMAVITNSRRASYGYDQRIEVHGSEGMLQVTNQLESQLVKSVANGVVAQKPQHFFLQRYAEAYRNELATLIEALVKGEGHYPSGNDGLQALLLADAALESLKTGKPVAPQSLL